MFTYTKSKDQDGVYFFSPEKDNPTKRASIYISPENTTKKLNNRPNIRFFSFNSGAKNLHYNPKYLRPYLLTSDEGFDFFGYEVVTDTYEGISEHLPYNVKAVIENEFQSDLPNKAIIDRLLDNSTFSALLRDETRKSWEKHQDL